MKRKPSPNKLKATLKNESKALDVSKRPVKPGTAPKPLRFNIPQKQGSDVGVNVRRIEGGFLVSMQHWERKTKTYKEKEVFTKTKPILEFK